MTFQTDPRPSHWNVPLYEKLRLDFSRMWRKFGSQDVTQMWAVSTLCSTMSCYLSFWPF